MSAGIDKIAICTRGAACKWPSSAQTTCIASASSGLRWTATDLIRISRAARITTQGQLATVGNQDFIEENQLAPKPYFE